MKNSGIEKLKDPITFNNQYKVSKYDSEKIRLNNKLLFLTRELEAVKKRYTEKNENEKADFNKKIDSYQRTLSDASYCINRFLPTLRCFEMDLLKHDIPNLKRLIETFEVDKTELVELAQELKAFENES